MRGGGPAEVTTAVAPTQNWVTDLCESRLRLRFRLVCCGPCATVCASAALSSARTRSCACGRARWRLGSRTRIGDGADGCAPRGPPSPLGALRGGSSTAGPACAPSPGGCGGRETGRPTPGPGAANARAARPALLSDSSESPIPAGASAAVAHWRHSARGGPPSRCRAFHTDPEASGPRGSGQRAAGSGRDLKTRMTARPGSGSVPLARGRPVTRTPPTVVPARPARPARQAGAGSMLGPARCARRVARRCCAGPGPSCCGATAE